MKKWKSGFKWKTFDYPRNTDTQNRSNMYGDDGFSLALLLRQIFRYKFSVGRRDIQFDDWVVSAFFIYRLKILHSSFPYN